MSLRVRRHVRERAPRGALAAPPRGRRLPLAAFAVMAAALAACSTGPAYVPPQPAMPAAWALEAPWQPATPGDAAEKGAWWRVFADPILDGLQAQALAQNPSLAVAAARIAQARAQVDLARAGLLPTVGLSAGAARQKNSANRPLTNYALPNTSVVQNDFRLGLSASYEPDLFGRVRLQIDGAQATSEQAGADFENTRLLLTAQLAATYYALRATDAEIDVVDRSLDLQRRALDFVRNRHDSGAASGLDLAQQQANLDASVTQLRLLRNQRQQTEHALATLAGVPAPSFALAPIATLDMTPPLPPIGLPSDLLQRRPDVAAAERTMAAANAQIGLTRAAYYPSLLLTPSVGWESNSLSRLIDAPSVLWSLGASVAGTLFDGGRRGAAEDAARAGYDLTVGSYRQTVLTALQEVQNGVSSATTLAQAYDEAQAAAASAQRLLDLANARYSGGLTTYLDVITAQQSLLTSQRQATQILGQRLQNAVFLIRALGGGWDGIGVAQAASR